MSSNPKLSPADEANPALDIYRQLRGLIVSGQLGAGERLPTVRQTASDLGVAPGTAARAYKMLEGEGLVISRTAAGTRVAESAGVLPASVMRRIRELVDEAGAVGADPDDVVDVFRTIWQPRPDSEAATTAEDTDEAED
ncbi:GntR family transcriptional regulator [Microbacterium sp. MYb62]|uniref:GntR family transcriptional regulator n=1 Tax=Microbacterium sp. MYb62 TaxID=1848690 RepID=UPI000CFDBEFF|nr:GntR family transcriptional regulator [Microbacterium sp. MYb62]PRB12091.1 GntR family transcriptional regulator [Microbacterium sp. MYb62]